MEKRIPRLTRGGVDQLLCLRENHLQHGLSEDAGKSVLLRRVIRGQQEGNANRLKKSAMSEGGGTLRGNPATLAIFANPGIPGDFSERDNAPKSGQELERLIQKRAALCYFFESGFVVRRRTMADCGNGAVYELQAVFA